MMPLVSLSSMMARSATARMLSSSWVTMTKVMPRVAASLRIRLSRPAEVKGIQSGRGLVQKENIRIQGHGPGNGRPFFHAPGQFVGQQVGPVSEVHHVQFDPGNGLGRVRREMGKFPQGKHDIVQHGHGAEKGPVLEGNPDAPEQAVSCIAPGRDHVLPVKEDLPFDRGLKTGHVFEYRAFPAAGAPQNDEHLSLADLKIQVFHDGCPVVTGPEVFDLYDGFAHMPR
jgi:hypothetical protein